MIEKITIILTEGGAEIINAHDAKYGGRTDYVCGDEIVTDMWTAMQIFGHNGCFTIKPADTGMQSGVAWERGFSDYALGLKEPPADIPEHLRREWQKGWKKALREAEGWNR